MVLFTPGPMMMTKFAKSQTPITNVGERRDRKCQVRSDWRCRMADKKKAVAAIDRGLFWVAYQLYWYDLACTDATKNGNGSVWTHLAVTKFLGNTDHYGSDRLLVKRWNLLGYVQIKKYWRCSPRGQHCCSGAWSSS